MIIERKTPAVTPQLQQKYGKSFDKTNLRRMMHFAERFPDYAIVAQLAQQLSWSHIIELLLLKSNEARLFYANEVAIKGFGRNELRKQISRKAFERREIANSTLSKESSVPFNVFKDPFLLDVLDLKEIDNKGNVISDYCNKINKKKFREKIENVLSDF